MSKTPKTNHVYCPHCDSNNEPYFSRSVPMGFYCRDCGKDVDEKQSDQTMSDTPRMDSAFNQPTSTTPERNWQRDQCYREGCKVERELAAVTEERDELKSKYRTHHDEAERITNEISRVSSVCRELKREVINWKTAHDIAIEQRDRAQDAIEMMLRDSSCRRIPACTEEQLAAVKGGSDD